MDDLRDSFSRLKKGIKHRLPGSKLKADKSGAGGSGERVGPSSSLSRPGTPVVMGGDREREGNEPNADDKNVELSAAPAENKSDWKSTASASAKLLLRGVRDSADAFGPLKSVAGGLCFILENCEVWSPSNATHNRSLIPQRTKANKESIESLAPQVKSLAELLCEPVPEGDVKEGERRKRLEL